MSIRDVARRKKGIRFERAYSNSMWHTDYKLLDDGRWFIAYMDDASRFITGYGVFEHATGQHAIEVLYEAIKNSGRPASILTDRDSQFYASKSESKKNDASEFEKELVKLGIRHILERVNQPQTNGKLKRFYGEVQKKLYRFHGIDYFVDWYNNIRLHMSLDFKTPAEMFVEKMPKNETVTDKQTDEDHKKGQVSADS